MSANELADNVLEIQRGVHFIRKRRPIEVHCDGLLTPKLSHYTGVANQLENALAAVFNRAQTLDFFLIGAGRDPWLLPETLRQRFRDLSLSVDTMPTGAAVRTYNILLAENRRVGAGLIAVA